MIEYDQLTIKRTSDHYTRHLNRLATNYPDRSLIELRERARERKRRMHVEVTPEKFIDFEQLTLHISH